MGDTSRMASQENSSGIPNGKTDGHKNYPHEEVTVLVTGFGPFQARYPVNPSFEITKSLPEVLPKLTPGGSKVRIISYPTQIRVAYQEVFDLVPQLHETYHRHVDLVLHIGMASGRKFYTLERYGHRDGYSKNKDLDDRTLPLDDGLIHFGDCPAVMTTSLEFDEVLRRWQATIFDLPRDSPAGGADCRPSQDAGHYLCDFIYFNSLAWYGRLNKQVEAGKASDRPVLFFHVPPDSDEEILARGKQVAISLIEAMVDSWSASMEKAAL